MRPWYNDYERVVKRRDKLEVEVERLRAELAARDGETFRMNETIERLREELQRKSNEVQSLEVERLQSELATSRELRSYQDKTIIRGRRIEEAARELLPVVQYFADLDNPYLGVEQERLMKLDGAIRALRAALGEES